MASQRDEESRPCPKKPRISLIILTTLFQTIRSLNPRSVTSNKTNAGTGSCTQRSLYTCFAFVSRCKRAEPEGKRGREEEHSRETEEEREEERRERERDELDWPTPPWPGIHSHPFSQQTHPYLKQAPYQHEANSLCHFTVVRIAPSLAPPISWQPLFFPGPVRFYPPSPDIPLGWRNVNPPTVFDGSCRVQKNEHVARWGVTFMARFARNASQTFELTLYLDFYAFIGNLETREMYTRAWNVQRNYLEYSD